MDQQRKGNAATLKEDYKMQEDAAMLAQAEQGARSRALWEHTSSEGLRRWTPGTHISANGIRLLVGIAPGYSLSDVELIDRILAARPFPSALELELFDVSEISEMKDIQNYIPNKVRFFHTPVVGVWLRGSLIRQAEGFAARKLILETIARGVNDLMPPAE